MGEFLMTGGPSFVTLKSLRICAKAKTYQEVNVYIDSIFVSTADKVSEYNLKTFGSDTDTSSGLKKPVTTYTSSITQSSEVSSTVSEQSTFNSYVLYIAIIGGSVLILAIIIIVLIKLRKVKQ